MPFPQGSPPHPPPHDPMIPRSCCFFIFSLWAIWVTTLSPCPSLAPAPDGTQWKTCHRGTEPCIQVHLACELGGRGGKQASPACRFCSRSGEAVTVVVTVSCELGTRQKLGRPGRTFLQPHGPPRGGRAGRSC